MTDENSSDPPSAEPAPAPRSEALSSGYRVELPTFEGPLDLLLHLIEQHELDIRDIPIAFVAQKYVEYITLLDQLNIDLASEYLVMAATLTHIKSKMLLPTPPADQDDEADQELDPRAELVRRLLEYQKYKRAAEQLGTGSVLGRDVFLRGLPAPSVEGPAPLAGLSLFKLLDAFQSVLSRATVKLDHQIDFERFSISDRINQLVDLLNLHKRLAFEQLFEGQLTRLDLIITFLALLEMTRLRMTRLEQSEPLSPITVELAMVSEEGAEGGNLPEGFASDFDASTDAPAAAAQPQRRVADSDALGIDDEEFHLPDDEDGSPSPDAGDDDAGDDDADDDDADDDDADDDDADDDDDEDDPPSGEKP